MRTRIQKWGNSLALRIPKSFAIESHLDQGSVVELSLVNGKLVIAPVLAAPVSLDGLLAGITEHNLHQEVDLSPAVGQEVW
jgi:antitoxin MazE